MLERFEMLLELHGVTIYRISKETGISQATLIEWKNGKYTPKVDKLQKIADYFHVPIDFLLGRPPFNVWDEINKDRRKFLKECNIDPDILDFVWGISSVAPYNNTPDDLEKFVKFIHQAIVSAEIDDSGKWNIVVQDAYRQKEKPVENDELKETFDSLYRPLSQEQRDIIKAMMREMRPKQ